MIDAMLDARQSRRLSRESRTLDRIERREAIASTMIGELCRDGATVHYVFPVGGRYREGSRADLIAYLTRNHLKA